MIGEHDLLEQYLSRRRFLFLTGLAGASVYATSARKKTIAKAGPGTAQATLEQRNPGVQTDMGWTPVGNPVPLPSEAGRGGTTLWTGLVTLPSARTPGKFRLVVEQFEELPVGTSILTGKLITQPRLIYSDIIPL